MCKWHCGSKIGVKVKNSIPQIQIIPLQDDYLSIRHHGREILGWNASRQSPRPYFFPVVGPTGQSITRMGHPAAADHGHHRSFWWGHNSVAGVDFWAEKQKPGNHPHVRQDNWFHLQDGEEEAAVACQLGWFDSQQVKLINQKLIFTVKPLANNELWIEIQTDFTPTTKELLLGKTNFGFMGLRVSKNISARFGNGVLRSSEGFETEKNIFAKSARWMDYSGTNYPGKIEGVTWFDHPSNPRHPVCWHVRDDGWMSPAFCLEKEVLLKQSEPLSLWYGLHVHAGDYNREVAEHHFVNFKKSLRPSLEKGESPWPYKITRK